MPLVSNTLLWPPPSHVLSASSSISNRKCSLMTSWSPFPLHMHTHTVHWKNSNENSNENYQNILEIFCPISVCETEFMFNEWWRRVPNRSIWSIFPFLIFPIYRYRIFFLFLFEIQYSDSLSPFVSIHCSYFFSTLRIIHFPLLKLFIHLIIFSFF